MPQKAIAELFGVEVPAINKHLTNIYESVELTKGATISILEIVQKEGNCVWRINYQKYTVVGDFDISFWHKKKDVPFAIRLLIQI